MHNLNNVRNEVHFSDFIYLKWTYLLKNSVKQLRHCSGFFISVNQLNFTFAQMLSIKHLYNSTFEWSVRYVKDTVTIM